jgi:5-methylthioribose kinase
MTNGEAFEETECLLSLDEPARTLEILQNLKVCHDDEQITAMERAGDGNMNLVMRVTTDRQSVIVKQARPWVEKYPTIAAPVDRILAEASFYELVSSQAQVAQMMPAVLAAHAKLKLLVLEDLGPASDYSSLYDGSDGDSRDHVFGQAASWLAQLHQTKLDSQLQVGCQPLRTLNHAHMFSIPLCDPPELDLDSVCPGLEKVSQVLRSDSKLQAAFEKLGDLYLHPAESGTALLHGDYYPGSWLCTDEGFRVIDSEFCFTGPREFDLGVMAAHYIFCHAPAELDSVKRLVDAYCDASKASVSLPLVLGFAGTEIIRRLLGVAQLPIEADLEQMKRWLDLGVKFVVA